MDPACNCLDMLAVFRLKELKDVLTQLGLSKRGRKEDLANRIGEILYDETEYKQEAERVIQDTYRNMLNSSSIASTSRGQAGPSSSKNLGNNRIDESPNGDNIRCVCERSTATDLMIKCEDPRCQVRQHIQCVIIAEENGALPSPEIFYCELCRLTRADPFWVTIMNPLYPVKMRIAKSSNREPCVERSFQLTSADLDSLLQEDHDFQAWCVLLNDKDTFRMQWPKGADLHVNGHRVKAVKGRHVSEPLGVSGQDDGPIISSCIREGRNNISLTASDSRVFCFGVRMVKRRTIQQILNLIPGELEGETLEDAVARVHRCVGGGTDSELEIVDGLITVSLRCPISGMRMKVAGRFKQCHHLGCFDLHVFLKMSHQTRKWLCPHCREKYPLENIVIDPYFNRIAAKMSYCEEDITDVEIKPDGSWRAKVEANHRVPEDIFFWHCPDGTLSPAQGSRIQPRRDTITATTRSAIDIDSEEENYGIATSSFQEYGHVSLQYSHVAPRLPENWTCPRLGGGGAGIKIEAEASGSESQQQKMSLGDGTPEEDDDGMPEEEDGAPEAYSRPRRHIKRPKYLGNYARK